MCYCLLREIVISLYIKGNYELKKIVRDINGFIFKKCFPSIIQALSLNVVLLLKIYIFSARILNSMVLTKKLYRKLDRKKKSMVNFFFFFFCSKPKFNHNLNSRNFNLPYQIPLFFIVLTSIKS